MPDVKYEVVKNVAVLSDKGKGWRKEINLVSWNGGKPKVDIREWREDHGSMKKGITLSRSEFNILMSSVNKIDVNMIADYQEAVTAETFDDSGVPFEKESSAMKKAS